MTCIKSEYSDSSEKREGTLEESYLEKYGNGYYYARVRATSKDINHCCNADWSELSLAYCRGGNSTQQLLQGLLSGNETDTKTIQNILENQIGTNDLKDAMEVDSAVIDLLEQLESKVGVTTSVTSSSDKINGTQIKVVGAGLNVKKDGKTVTLQVDNASADAGLIPSMYGNTLQFSMHLEGVEESEGKQPLAVPVKITLPVPASIDPQFLVILHETGNGYQEIRPTLEEKDGQIYASFVVTSFSNFAMAETALTAAKSQGTVTANALLPTAESMKTAFCAVYDADGRQITTAVIPVGSARGTVEILNVVGAASVKVFFLNDDSKPVGTARSCTLS